MHIYIVYVYIYVGGAHRGWGQQQASASRQNILKSRPQHSDLIYSKSTSLCNQLHAVNTLGH